MKTPSPLAAFAAAGLCLGLGFLLGRSGRKDGSIAHAPAPPAAMGTTQIPGDSGEASNRRDPSTGDEPTAEVVRPASSDRGERRDPVARLEVAMESGSTFSRIIRMLMVTSQLTPEEIPGVLAFAEGRSKDEREIMRVGALARWAELDPLGAAEWARTRPSPDRSNDQLLEMAVTEWAGRDAGAARAWIAQLDDRGQRQHAMQGFLNGLAARDPAGALREANALPVEERARALYASIFSTWAKREPGVAAAQAAQLPDSDARNGAIESVLDVWTQRAPQEALAWALRQDAAADQRTFAGTILNQWAQLDARAALTQTLGLAPELRDQVVDRVVDYALRGGFEEARSFAERLPPGAARDRTFVRIGTHLAERDPRQGVEFARQLGAGPAQKELLATTARLWSQRNPAEAAVFVAQLPEDGTRAQAAGEVVAKWAKKDAQAAAQWIERLPPGDSRDKAAATYAREVRNADPAGAMAWAGTVGDLVQREKVASEVLMTWRAKDPAAANAWLETTQSIGDDLRSVLRRMK